MSDSPNFRLSVRAEGDDYHVTTTLRDFLADNEGAAEVCAKVQSLAPGDGVSLGGGAAPVFHVQRFAKGSPRFTRVRVPVQFDGADFATVTIDRKRLTLSIRPARKRTVFELELPDFAQTMLERQSKLNALAKRKARKARR